MTDGSRALVPITSRGRRYGYVTWPKNRDAAMHALLGDHETVNVIFAGADLGERRVDWKYRRISVGPRCTRGVGQDATVFELEPLGDGRVQILWR